MSSWKNMDPNGHNQAIQDALENLGFEDTSWGNDMCPSFHSDESGLRLWIDYADPEHREMPNAQRYGLVRMNGDMEFMTDIIATESWGQVLERIKQELRCLK